MNKRGKVKKGTSDSQYYLVFIIFGIVCVGAVIYIALNPKQNFADKLIVDEFDFVTLNFELMILGRWNESI